MGYCLGWRFFYSITSFWLFTTLQSKTRLHHLHKFTPISVIFCVQKDQSLRKKHYVLNIPPHASSVLCLRTIFVFLFSRKFILVFAKMESQYKISLSAKNSNRGGNIFIPTLLSMWEDTIWGELSSRLRTAPPVSPRRLYFLLVVQLSKRTSSIILAILHHHHLCVAAGAAAGGGGRHGFPAGVCLLHTPSCLLLVVLVVAADASGGGATGAYHHVGRCLADDGGLAFADLVPKYKKIL